MCCGERKQACGAKKEDGRLLRVVVNPCLAFHCSASVIRAALIVAVKRSVPLFLQPGIVRITSFEHLPMHEVSNNVDTHADNLSLFCILRSALSIMLFFFRVIWMLVIWGQQTVQRCVQPRNWDHPPTATAFEHKERGGGGQDVSRCCQSCKSGATDTFHNSQCIVSCDDMFG